MSVAAPCKTEVGVQEILSRRIATPAEIAELENLGFVRYAQANALRRINTILGKDSAHLRKQAYGLFDWELDSHEMKPLPQANREDLRACVGNWVDCQVYRVLKAMRAEGGYPEHIDEEYQHYQRRVGSFF